MSDATKTCSICGVERPESEYHKYRGGRRAECKACGRRRNAKWRAENPEAARQHGRRYRRRHGDRERARKRRRYAANQEAERVRRRESERSNRASALVREARRRAHKAAAPQGDPQVAAEYAGILREGICEQCGAKENLQIDHIHPLARGGEHGWENFAGLCGSCNARKRDKPLLTAMLDSLS